MFLEVPQVSKKGRRCCQNEKKKKNVVFTPSELYFHCHLDMSAGYWLQLLSLGPMYLLPQKDDILQNTANPQRQNFSNNKLQLLFYKIIAIEDTFKKDTQSN